MKFVSILSLIFLAALKSQNAQAQLDSSYELLLGVPASNQPSASVKSKKPAKKNIEKSAEKIFETEEDKRIVASEPNVVAGPAPTGRPLPIKLEPAAGESISSEPSFATQAQSLFTASPEPVLNYYSDNLEASDHRRNKVEIAFAPTFMTNESSSNYSYRNYRSVSSAVSVGANIWLTPAIGLGGTFLFSLGADTSGDAITGNRSPARHEMFDLAIKLRQFFGLSSQSKSIEYDLLFAEYKFNVPSDDVYRARLKTSGFGFKTSLRLPTSSEFAWVVGGSFFPRIQHRELAAGSTITSGENAENTRIGLHLGAELNLTKESQLFWEASATSERDLFTGSANLADATSGVAPKNVSVTNSFYLMNFGYRWGN